MDNTLKYKIVEKILQIDDENLLYEIKSLIGLSDTDFWTETPVEVQKAIRTAIAEFERGEGIPHAKVMSDIKSRFLSK